jgi:hypothetical protein
MSVQASTAVRNATLDQRETTIGTSPILEIRSGSVEANCAAVDSGTLLVSMTLPSDWMNAASGGTKTLLGTWSANAGATGTAAHWRLKNSGGSTVHLQGTVTATSGGGDIELSTASIVNGGLVTITAFTWTEGNA